MKKKYIIIENSGSPHEKGLFAIARLLLLNGHEVAVFAGKKNFDRVSILNEKYRLEVKKLDYCALIYKRFFSTKHVHLIFNTTSTRNCVINLLIAIVYFGRNVFYIRNARSWLHFSTHDRFLKYTILRAIVYFSKRVMLRTRSSLLVEKTTIKKYLYDHDVRDVDVIPYMFFENLNVDIRKISGPSLKIVSPGVIDFNKKDLLTIIEAMEIMLELGIEVKLTFLGKVKSSKDEEICRFYKKKFKESFTYYTNFIPEKNYDSSLQAADIILGSFKIDNKCEYFDEIYGTTKGSGVDAHAFSMAKVLFVNEGYEVDTAYKAATVFFKNSADLSSKISRLYDDRTLMDDLNMIALKCSLEYVVENFADEIVYLR